jgi:tetratricopeptide (TPR) repeat protein
MDRGLHEALAKCDRTIARNPDHAEGWKNRGTVLLHLWYQTEAARIDDGVAHLKEALASLDRAITLKPDYPEAFNNRGAVLHLLGRVEEALASFDQAIAQKPGFANAFVNRAWANFSSGIFAKDGRTTNGGGT